MIYMINLLEQKSHLMDPFILLDLGTMILEQKTEREDTSVIGGHMWMAIT